MIKADDLLYDTGKENIHTLEDDAVDDDEDEDHGEDQDDDDGNGDDDEQDGGDDGDEEENNSHDGDDGDDGDDELPTTPNAYSSTPMHIQPYYASYPPYYPPHPTDYMMTGPINPHAYTDASTMADPVTDTRRNRGGVTEPFPEKMHRMLDGTEQEGLTDVVSFFSHGRAFAIHKPRRFVSEIMPRYFRQTRLTSFQRQLNLYGFRRISQGPDNGGYYHELFLRGRPGLCVNMKRTKVKGILKHKRDPEAGPNFYAMRPITGAPPPLKQSPLAAQGYHTYPAYSYFPPYTVAQAGGYSYAPYYYQHWGYAPPPGSPETPVSTPGGESHEGDHEDRHHDDDDEETHTKDDDNDDDDEQDEDDNDGHYDEDDE